MEKLRTGEGTLALQVQALAAGLEDSQSWVVDGGTTVHMPPCRADPSGCLRFSEPKTELSSGLRSPLCHPEQLKAKQHFISDI